MIKEPTISSNTTIKLLRTIGSPLVSTTEISEEDNASLERYDLAVKNKIPLLYLEALKKQGKLNELKRNYEEEHARYLKSLKGLNKVSGILDGANIEYVIFKTIKPYLAVPGDIDILILDNNDTYKRAWRIFVELGYRYGGVPDNTIGPSMPDLIDPEREFIVDIQGELELSYVIYMDKNKLKRHKVKKRITPGLEIKALTSEVDLATVIIHSVVEYLYLLGEFYTFLYSLANMNEKGIDDFVALLKEFKINAAAKSFVTITASLHEAAFGVIPEKLEYVSNKLGYEKSEAKKVVKSDFKMPHRYDVSTVVKVVLEKMGERRFRKSVALQLSKMLRNPGLIKFMIDQVIELWKREFYLKGTE